MESHQRDHENYVACLRSHPRRAKALLDFERHDDDELGFRKNDIITVSGERGADAFVPASPEATGGLAEPSRGQSSQPRMKSGNWSCVSRPFPPQIISQKDEHCWVGELNGLRGEASIWSCVALGKGKAGLAGKLQRTLGLLRQRHPLLPCVLSPVVGSITAPGRPLLTGPASPTGWFPAKFVEVLDERSKEVRRVHTRQARPRSRCCLCPVRPAPSLQGLRPDCVWLVAVAVRTGRGWLGRLRPRPPPSVLHRGGRFCDRGCHGPRARDPLPGPEGPV